MLDRFRPIWKLALAGVALGAIVPLAACNKALPVQSESSRGAPSLPDLPATFPLALGAERPIAYAPPAKALPRARPIQAARIADPNDYYAYADDAWSYYDALGDAPPDYGFHYDDVEPWAWQGYDDSLMFVEPLDAGYRYYHYRPGEEYPYFIRDPEWGYGYDDGSLAVVYDAYGRVLPYDDYLDGPWLDYASRYYDRGYRLYGASRARHPVIAANWYEVRPAYTVAFLDWEDDLWRQPDWWDYRERTGDRRDRYWRDERARREAEAIRYAAWRDSGFQVAAPPRAIPVTWQSADWARDERRFAPAVAGFAGDDVARQRAVRTERQRVASLAEPREPRDQVQLAALRERVRPHPEVDTLRVNRTAERRRQLEVRQVQLASRDDRAARRERMLVQRQEQQLARAQQRELRRDRRVETSRLTGLNRRPVAEPGDFVATERRLKMRTPRGQSRPADQQQAWQQALVLSPPQRLEQREEARQRRQAQIGARGQGQQRQEARQRTEIQQRQTQVEERQPNAAQLRNAMEQRRAIREQQRAAQQQVRQQRVQSEAQAQAGNARSEQARQMAVQRRAMREQQHAAQEQARHQRAQSEVQQRARHAQREQARQASEQQRVIGEQQHAARDQARQQRMQVEAQRHARHAQREEARQVAEQQRAVREQRQAAQDRARQQRAQSEAEASARHAQREQARQAAELQRATRDQERQAAEQQRAQRQQQAPVEAQGRGQRTAQTDSPSPSNGKADKDRRGRGQN